LCFDDELKRIQRKQIKEDETNLNYRFLLFLWRKQGAKNNNGIPKDKLKQQMQVS
jgi:hypothetical protein